MGKWPLLGIVALGIVLVVVLGSGDDDPLQLYRNDEFGFSIRYPQEWKPAPDMPGSAVGFVSPMMGLTDLFRESVQVIVFDVEPGTELDEALVREAHDGLWLGPENYTILDRRVEYVSDLKAERVVSAKQDGGAIHRLMYMLIQDTTVYVILCTSTDTAFEKYEGVFDEISSTLLID